MRQTPGQICSLWPPEGQGGLLSFRNCFNAFSLSRLVGFPEMYNPFMFHKYGQNMVETSSKVVLNGDNGCKFLIMDVALLDLPKKETERLE